MEFKNKVKKFISPIAAIAAAITMITSTSTTVTAAVTNKQVFPYIQGQAHVQNIGWMAPTTGYGIIIGTTGRALRMECVKLGVTNIPSYYGGLEINTFVEGIGWTGYRRSHYNDLAISGTTGRSLAIKDVQIRLYGELANHYNVEYAVHLANRDWQAPVFNGAEADRVSNDFNVEALLVRLIHK